jgi:hypothetical protein
MTIIATAIFTLAFLLSAYAMLLTLAQKWPRIEAVVEQRGMPTARVIHMGQTRYTGARMRLVSVNEPALESWQGAFAFHQRKAA